MVAIGSIRTLSRRENARAVLTAVYSAWVSVIAGLRLVRTVAAVARVDGAWVVVVAFAVLAARPQTFIRLLIAKGTVGAGVFTTRGIAGKAQSIGIACLAAVAVFVIVAVVVAVALHQWDDIALATCGPAHAQHSHARNDLDARLHGQSYVTPGVQATTPVAQDPIARLVSARSGVRRPSFK